MSDGGGSPSALAAPGSVASDGPSLLVPRRRPVPLWFDDRAPPELDCQLQLLKHALRCERRVAQAGAEAGAEAGCDGGGKGGGASAGHGDAYDEDDHDSDLFGCYSAGAVLADHILRTLEDEVTCAPIRRFAVAASATDLSPTIHIILLSAYVTLATNLAAAPGASRRCSGLLATGARVSDAIKVLYAVGPATARESAALAGLSGGGAAAAMLVLPEAEERRAVLEALQASTAMLPPVARAVGALSVGYLPVAPTWD